MTVLETRRLLLRPLRESDAETLVRELNNFAIARNTARIPYPYSAEDATDFLAFAKALDQRSLCSAVEAKEHPGPLIGVISCEWNAAKNDAELGYWYSQPVWGKGYGTEAARTVVDHAFAVAGHDQIVACYHNDNPASARILTNLGFVEVGACISYSKAQGREVPVTNLRLTREIWSARQAHLARSACR